MSQPPHTADEVEAIDSLREAYVAAVNNGDADSWAAAFTDDAVQMPPHAPTNHGSARIRAWCKAFLAPFHATFVLLVCEVHVAGEWAYERGSYTITLSPRAGGEPVKDIGKYVTIYARQDGGSWRIARDIWNSNLRAFLRN